MYMYQAKWHVWIKENTIITLHISQPSKYLIIKPQKYDISFLK